jgi:hypothetical protein
MPFTPFGTPREKPVFESNIKKTVFLDMNGTSTVRALSTEKFEVQTHWINRATVLCLGEECPVCASNKMLIMQFPDTFREESKYSPRRTVCMVNVLDRTSVRTCECGLEYRATPGAVTCKCGKIVTAEAAPSNKVKVLSRGVTLFDQFDAINNAILDAKGERIGLTGYDITLVISGAGKEKVITPIAGQASPMPAYNEEDLFDLDTVTIKLTPTEMVDLMRGVSLKDIFAARRAASKAASVTEDVLPKELMDSVQSDVDALFKN